MNDKTRRLLSVAMSALYSEIRACDKISGLDKMEPHDALAMRGRADAAEDAAKLLEDIGGRGHVSLDVDERRIGAASVRFSCEGFVAVPLRMVLEIPADMQESERTRVGTVERMAEMIANEVRTRVGSALAGHILSKEPRP